MASYSDVAVFPIGRWRVHPTSLGNAARGAATPTVTSLAASGRTNLRSGSMGLTALTVFRSTNVQNICVLRRFPLRHCLFGWDGDAADTRSALAFSLRAFLCGLCAFASDAFALVAALPRWKRPRVSARQKPGRLPAAVAHRHSVTKPYSTSGQSPVGVAMVAMPRCPHAHHLIRVPAANVVTAL